MSENSHEHRHDHPTSPSPAEYPGADPVPGAQAAAGIPEVQPAGPQRRRVRGLFAIDAKTPDDVFTGWHDPDVVWNGWATPAFDRRNTERVVAWMTADSCDDQIMSFAWDGDVLVMTETDGEQQHVQRIEADAEGLYSLGAFAWVWYELRVPEGESLASWLRRSQEDRFVHTRASNFVIVKALDLGITGTDVRRAAGRAGDRAVTELAAIRPNEPDENLPPGTIEYLTVPVDGAIPTDLAATVISWAQLSDDQRQRLQELAIARAIHAQRPGY